MTRDPAMTTRDRRARQTFWIDDRVIDAFAPVMGHYSFGMAALSVYTALARHADRDSESWPRLRAIAHQVGVSERTVQRVTQVLELLGLVEVTWCYRAASARPAISPPCSPRRPCRWSWTRTRRSGPHHAAAPSWWAQGIGRRPWRMPARARPSLPPPGRGPRPRQQDTPGRTTQDAGHHPEGTVCDDG